MTSLNPDENNRDEKYLAILSAISDTVLMTDDQGVITFICPNINIIFGYSITEVEQIHTIDTLLGIDLLYRYPPRSFTELRNIEIEILDKFQQTHTLLVNMKHVNFDEGTILFTCRDITERKRAELLLQKEALKAQQYLDVAEVIMMALDKTGQITLINQKGCKVLGYTEAELIGKDWIETCVPDTIRATIRVGFDGMMNGTYPYTEYYENDLITSSGEIRRFAWHNKLLRDDKDGSIIGVLSSGEDITDEIRAAAALARSEMMYRMIVNTAQEGIWVVDNESRTTYANPRIAEMLGYTPDEMMGRTFFEFIDPDFRPSVAELAKIRQRTGHVQAETHYRHRNGSSLWGLMVSSNLYNEKNEQIGAIGFITDITAAKKAQESLNYHYLLEKVLSSVFAALIFGTQNLEQDIVNALDILGQFTESEHIVVYWSDGVEKLNKAFQWSSKQVPSTADQAVAESLNISDFAKYWNESNRFGPIVMRSTEALSIKTLQQTPLIINRGPLYIPMVIEGQLNGMVVFWAEENGTRFWNPSLVQMLNFAVNAISNIIAHNHVNQEREKLINELAARNEELDRFTYTVSHDLKSPLISIEGFLGYLQLDLERGNADRVTKDIEHINNSVHRMGELLAGLLELSRVGRLINTPQKIPLATLIQDVLTMIKGQRSARHIKITVAENIHEGWPVVSVDRPRIVQVLTNLIDNAIKFMGDQLDPQIKIGASDSDNEVVCYVQDNGIGIDPRYQSRIFDLFDRLDPTVPGTGIGLALVKRIVEVHQGRIWAESTGLGSGSTFYFTLPIAEGE